ncbi:MAG: hypothetical protein NDJ90_07405 [Oligoflexia bacterium]|nr:hypothetical protein [Oligoflexia bacterium]
MSSDDTDAPAEPGPSPTPTPTPTPTASPTPAPSPILLSAQESIALPNLAGKKKIDFLFVVDNSPSMGDDQDRLAAGFAKFASTFFLRTDLNICTAITTTDRHLGKTQGNGTANDRFVACTNPEGSEGWTDAQRTAHANAIIQDFITKVKVGEAGSGAERAGKSLVSFLYDAPQWSTPLATTTLNSFFRQDATANISFITDESNWFRFAGSLSDEANDLPHRKGATTPQGTVDNRKGIQDYLDDYFSALNSKAASVLNYTITSLLHVTLGTGTFPGLAQNLSLLTSSVGRGSVMGDILGDANAFTALYEQTGQNVLSQAKSAKLAHAFYEPNYPDSVTMTVTLVRASGARVALVYKTDFTLVAPNGVLFSQALAESFAAGDTIEIDYGYLSN